MSIKCGNPIHKPDAVYHETPADVRECYANSGRFSVAKATGPDPMKEAMVAHTTPPAWQDTGWSPGKPCPFPAGRYAILDEGVTKFFKIDAPDEGRWAGYVFVKIQASDELHPIKDREYKTRIINEIAKDPQAAMLAYGRELGHCGHCGRTLTNEESRAAGIGPVCAGKMGW